MRIRLFRLYHDRFEARDDAFIMTAVGFVMEDALSLNKGKNIIVEYSLSRKGER